MNTNRVLVLPGSSSPWGSARYQTVYALIQTLAEELHWWHKLRPYRGQTGKSSETLSYTSAVEDVLRDCAACRPTWLVARSFGCHVAAGALAAGGEWLSDCRGAVLWGPVLSHVVTREYATETARQADTEGHKRYGVFLASDFHSTLPAIESLIPKIRCNLRLCRGSKDDLNNIADLDNLANLHAQTQCNFQRDVCEVIGVEHSVVPQGLSEETRECYQKCLFSPIPRGPDRTNSYIV